MNGVVRAIANCLVAFVILTALCVARPEVARADNRNNGGGTCWDTDQAWPLHYFYYWIDSNIPDDWITYIDRSAATWNAGNDNTTTIYRKTSDTYHNWIYLTSLGSNYWAAEVSRISVTGTTIQRLEMRINGDRPIYPHQLFPDKTNSSFDVQNLFTHEFGHFGFIDNMPDSDRTPAGDLVSCKAQTMWPDFGYGDQARRSLETYDKWGINWQYP